MPTGRQIRAARMLLEWDAKDLAEQTGLTKVTIFNIELDKFQARDASIDKIVRAFNDNGVEFVGDHGVQYVQHKVRTLVGTEGLKSFFEDVRTVAKQSNQETVAKQSNKKTISEQSNKEIVICGIDEQYLEEKLGDFVNVQRQAMAAIPNVKMRCLIEENDFDLGASDYCRYRWQAKENFSNVPFYIYGDKLAIIVTTAPENPLILLIQNRTITEAYRRQFDAMWNAAIEPNKKQVKK